MNSSASASPASSRWSALFSTVNVVTDSPATRPSRSRSLADTGGSAVSTNTAASIDCSASCAACGVPLEDRTGARRVHQLDPAGQDRRVQVHGHARDPAAVARVAPFGHQVGQRVSGCFSSCPSRNLTSARGSSPYRTVVVTAVSGVTPDGQHVTAEQRVDQRALAPFGLADDQDPQPRLVQAVRERPSCSRSRSVPSAASSFRAVARALSPFGIGAILLPASCLRLVGTVGGGAAFASPAHAGGCRRGEPLRRA